MRIEAEVEAPGGPVKVLLVGGAVQRIWGKFVFGGLKGEPGKRALVFDDQAVFHKAIAAASAIAPAGGGWIEIDQTNQRVRVGGRSTQFGRELDRGLTAILLEEALPDYFVESE
jgi:hypothetical protein